MKKISLLTTLMLLGATIVGGFSPVFAVRGDKNEGGVIEQQQDDEDSLMDASDDDQNEIEE